MGFAIDLMFRGGMKMNFSGAKFYIVIIYNSAKTHLIFVYIIIFLFFKIFKFDLDNIILENKFNILFINICKSKY